MRKGHRRLLIFEIIIFVFLFINSFILNFLSGIKISVFLLILLILFKFLFGFEKDRHRYVKDFLLDVVIFLITFLILYYLLGLLTGFSKGNYWNYLSIKNFMLPIASYVVFRELFRYMCLCKSEGSKILTIVSVLVIICMDVTNATYFTFINKSNNAFIFLAMTFLPALFNNVSLSYITKMIGYKPILLYCLVLELYMYVLPIAPAPSQYIVSVVNILLPAFFAGRTYNFFEKIKDKSIDRDYYKRTKSVSSLVVMGIISAVLVYFTSGHFDQWAVVIASGSMSKTINKGDIVIINKVKKDFGNINVGDVLAYKNNEKIIVHRVVDKYELDNKFYFRTKGDANNDIDNIIIEEDMIIGIITFKIPYVGLPTVWLIG